MNKPKEGDCGYESLEEIFSLGRPKEFNDFMSRYKEERNKTRRHVKSLRKSERRNK